MVFWLAGDWLPIGNQYAIAGHGARYPRVGGSLTMLLAPGFPQRIQSDTSLQYSRRIVGGTFVLNGFPNVE